MNGVAQLPLAEIPSAPTDVPVAPVPPVENQPSDPPAVPSAAVEVPKPAATSRVRRRSTSSRSSRSARSLSRSSSRSPPQYYRRGRYRRSRSRVKNRSRSRSRSGRYRRRRSSRTPSYRPPLRRQAGRPRRFSPYRPNRATAGRVPPYSSFPRRDGHASPKGPNAPPPPLAAASRRSSPPLAPRAGSVESGRMPPLTERFERLVETTMRHRRRDHGVLGGLAHLILTNRLKLPLPTLMREAKELSVVIERDLPPEVSDVIAEISFNFDLGPNFAFPHPPNAGHRPVFDRSEIPLFSKPEDNEKVTERMVAVLSSGVDFRMGGQSADPRGEADQGRPDSNFRQRRINAFSRLGPSNPLDVPKGASYFMHDDRDGRSYGSRRRRIGAGGYSRNEWHRKRSDYDVRDSRQKSFRTSRFSDDGDDGGERHHRSGRRSALPDANDEGRWCHDKFLELEKEANGRGVSRPSSASSSASSSTDSSPKHDSK
uniref:Btz domain-containing protein n=1 Tax=Mesocestoides corti TaxID=53468 RepID=A0A5K3EPJ4_MESCO